MLIGENGVPEGQNDPVRQSAMRLSVLVPSYRRPKDLDRCLGALAGQTRAAEQVTVVVRNDDDETRQVATNWRHRLPIEIVEVAAPGVVHALNAGLARSVGDILAITDDDAAPRPDWLARIEAHYAADPTLGGVGGRDWVHRDGKMEMGAKTTVGRILWFGRIVGNHHLGVGPAREVELLKGVNWSFRMAAIRPVGFDTRLRGSGAQVYNEVLAALGVRRAGWRLLYDPAVAVDHFHAPRFDRDKRWQFDPIATADRAFNLHLALKEVTPWWRRIMALTWQELYGTRDEPGFVSLLLLIVRRDPHAFSRYRAAHHLTRDKN